MRDFVAIHTTDTTLLKLMEQIQKYELMMIWVRRADALLEKYHRGYDQVQTIYDDQESTRIFAECESQMIAATTLFLRCFMDQPTTHLNIRDITRDKELIECYKDLMDLRDDEYVHWKGRRSELAVEYSFDVNDDGKVDFAKAINVTYRDRIGPGTNIDSLKKLLATAIDHMEKKTEAVLDCIRRRLSEPEARGLTELRRRDGRPAVRNTQRHNNSLEPTP